MFIAVQGITFCKCWSDDSNARRVLSRDFAAKRCYKEIRITLLDGLEIANMAGDAEWRIKMGVLEQLRTVQFLVDPDGNKRAVVIEYSIWEELLALLEELEDAEEIRRLREAGEEAISWEEAKAELRAGGVDV